MPHDDLKEYLRMDQDIDRFPLETHPLFEDVERVHLNTIVAYVPAGADHVGLQLPMNGTYIATSTMNVFPTSRGTVTLRSTDPQHSPVINPNHLATEADKARLRFGVRKAMKIMLQTQSGQDTVQEEVSPPGLVPLTPDSTDAEINDRISRTAVNFKHASGTCAMGEVVDSECRVLGVRGLRVVDASILPNPTTGWPQACLYALAERAADMIVGQRT
ncbi:MAG: hypothetical protein Q9162_006350 [Coniocarpon cinnabarinum]